MSAGFVLKAASLTALSGIAHAFFTRRGGVSEGTYSSLNGGVGSRDLPERVAENRARMATALGVAPDHLITAYQVHSPAVVIADRPWGTSDRPRADAVVAKTPGLAVAVSTADCGAILFADERARVVAATHAGWRGALAGVAEATIEVMERCGADRARIVAALGPMIRQAHYEIGPEFVARFKAADQCNDRFFQPSGRVGHAFFDLAGYIVRRLDTAGISQIEDLGRCTYADADLFFSYRRSVHQAEADYGRHINAIAIQN